MTPRSQKFSLSVQISLQNRSQIRQIFSMSIRVSEGEISEKKTKFKISWHCPFKNVLFSIRYRGKSVLYSCVEWVFPKFVHDIISWFTILDLMNGAKGFKPTVDYTKSKRACHCAQ